MMSSLLSNNWKFHAHTGFQFANKYQKSVLGVGGERNPCVPGAHVARDGAGSAGEGRTTASPLPRGQLQPVIPSAITAIGP